MELVRKLPCSHYWKRRPGKNPVHIKRKLKKEQLRDHIKGLYAVGLSPIRPGTDTTRVALFDLDNHSEQSINVRRIALELEGAAFDRGLLATSFTSSSGRGVHVYFVWDDDQDAASCIALLTQVLEDCLLLPGTGGLEKSQVEIFPKQASVDADSYGSMFILPYAFESEWLSGSWQASQSVPVIPKVDSRDTPDAGEVDPELLRSAVAALPNADVDYDEWRNTVFAIHAASGGTDAGLALAREWSSKSDKHDDEFLSERVWPYAKAGKGITARTLLAKAHAAGWHDDIAVQFDDLGEEEKEQPLKQGDTNGDKKPAAVTKKQAKDVTLPGFARDSKGRIEATLVNIEAALRAAMPGGDLGFDSFTQQIMLRRGGEWQALRETANVAMRLELERKGFKPIAKEAFRDVLLKVAEETTFDSAQDWLHGLTWDAVPRVEKFLTTYFGVIDSGYHRSVARYWWSAMAGRVCQPGIQTDMVPVLVGEQGTGKSTALTRMVPCREQLVEIDLTARDADLSRIMQGALIGEIAELRGLNSREDEHIKAFVTRTQEKWVPKYQEYPRVFDRRLLFVGTTNQTEFLSDHTGNRRWLPVRVGVIDRDRLEADRDQLWAEAHTLYREHGVLFQQAEKLAKVVQADFEIEDPWEVTIGRYLRDVQTDFRPESVTDVPRVGVVETLVLSGVMPDVSRINRGHHMRLSRIMRRFGWEHVKFYEDGRQVRGYSPPEELA